MAAEKVGVMVSLQGHPPLTGGTLGFQSWLSPLSTRPLRGQGREGSKLASSFSM